MARNTRKESNVNLLFFSKDWIDAQKSAADRDFKLMVQRVQSFKSPFSGMANSFNQEWENCKKISLSLSLSGFQILENQILDSNNENQSRNMEMIGFWRPPPPSKIEPCFAQKCQPFFEDHLSNEIRYKQSKRDRRFLLDWEGMKLALQEWEKSRKGKQTYSLQEWEPLRRLRVSIMEIEETLIASSTPIHFLENLRRMEFFGNTKKFMNLPTSISSSEKEFFGEENPFDVSELFESLVRQSEPLLHQLGLKKDFCGKICSSLQIWKNYNHSASGDIVPNKDIAMVLMETRKAAKELDLRIATLLHSSGYTYSGDIWGRNAFLEDKQELDKRNITIATTASLPWMTGTAINPLLRAAYLARSSVINVTLLVPWLSKKDQRLVYPNQMTFNAPQDQERYIREWLNSRISFQPDFNIVFYPGKFALEKRSILPVDDMTQFIPEVDADIAVLEEPEHLTWYHHGARWTQKFRYVVGIVHTNYLEYVKREKNGPLQAFFLKYVNTWMANIYCHKVIRLSAATQYLPKSVVCNVHGVSPKFLEIGRSMILDNEDGHSAFTHKSYFLGKMVWGKGYRELLDLWSEHKEDFNDIQLDVFGNGEDSLAIREEAKRQELRINFHEGRDHADSSLHSYKVFINPSVSDVVCTTTAEALAMGKFVICADHPSNEFFKSFPNCYTYKTSEQFVDKIKQAMSAEPLPLSSEHQYMLSWEAATERFLRASELDKVLLEDFNARNSHMVKNHRYLKASVAKVSKAVDHGMFLAHYWLSGIEFARLISGALPGTIHMDEEQQRDLGLLTSLGSED